MIVFTREEIKQLYKEQPDDICEEMDLVIAKAQARKIFEWLMREDARNYTGTLDNADILIIKVHKDNWQAFKKEVE